MSNAPLPFHPGKFYVDGVTRSLTRAHTAPQWELLNRFYLLIEGEFTECFQETMTVVEMVYDEDDNIPEELKLKA